MAAIPIVVVTSGLLAYGTANAAFRAQTSNRNTWTAGGLALPEAGTAQVAFTTASMSPGARGTRCIVVTYVGRAATDTPAEVRFHLASLKDGGSAAQLDVTLDAGQGTAPGCDDFLPSTTLFTGSLRELADAAKPSGSGLGAWSAPPGSSRTYRIRWHLDPLATRDPNTAAQLTWSAQHD